jgi:hypothetical protein
MIPVDQSWVALLSIPLFQIFVKGASHRALAFAWIVTICMSNVSLFLVRTQEYFIWLNFAHIVMVCISYEMERTILVSFMNLSLLRRAHDEGHRLQSRLYEADVTTKGLISNLHMITCISDEVRASLDGVRCTVETLQCKLRQPAESGLKHPLRATECVAIASSALEGVSMTMKVLDDLSILEKIVRSDQGIRRPTPQKKAVGFTYHGGNEQWRPMTGIHEQANARGVGAGGPFELASQVEAEAGDEEEEFSAYGALDDPELTTIHSHSSRNRQSRSQRSDTEKGVSGAQLAAALQDAQGQGEDEDEDEVSDDPRALGLSRLRASMRPWVRLVESEEPTFSGKSREDASSSEACTVEHNDLSFNNQFNSSGNTSNSTLVPDTRFPIVGGTDRIAVPSPQLRCQPSRKPVLGIIEELTCQSQESPRGEARLLTSPVSAFVSKGAVHLMNNARQCLHSPTIELDVDSRVLSDEDCAALPSPVAVMFPFAPDDDQDDYDDDDTTSAPDSLTMNDNELSSYISKLATTIATELKSVTTAERALRAFSLELTPLQLLRRMPQQGAEAKTSQFCMLESENARILDIIESISIPGSRCRLYSSDKSFGGQAHGASPSSLSSSSPSLPPTVYLRSLIVAVQNQFRPVDGPPLHNKCNEFVKTIRPKTNDRLNNYVHELTIAMYRDMRSTCDIFELLICNLNDDWGEGPYALLEDQHRLAFLQEYLSVIRVLMVQSSASLLATIDNVAAIRVGADLYQKMMKKKN